MNHGVCQQIHGLSRQENAASGLDVRPWTSRLRGCYGHLICLGSGSETLGFVYKNLRDPFLERLIDGEETSAFSGRTSPFSFVIAKAAATRILKGGFGRAPYVTCIRLVRDSNGAWEECERERVSGATM